MYRTPHKQYNQTQTLCANGTQTNAHNCKIRWMENMRMKAFFLFPSTPFVCIVRMFQSRSVSRGRAFAAFSWINNDVRYIRVVTRDWIGWFARIFNRKYIYSVVLESIDSHPSVNIEFTKSRESCVGIPPEVRACCTLLPLPAESKFSDLHQRHNKRQYVVENHAAATPKASICLRKLLFETNPLLNTVLPSCVSESSDKVRRTTERVCRAPRYDTT